MTQQAKSDRELLEAAAKAAGLQVADGQHGLSVWVDASHGIGGWWKDWNPLTDDGDALRLAVKLRLGIDADRDPICCYSDFYTVLEAKDGDPYAATRRAIVRAAAAISRAGEA